MQLCSHPRAAVVRAILTGGLNLRRLTPMSPSIILTKEKSQDGPGECTESNPGFFRSCDHRAIRRVSDRARACPNTLLARPLLMPRTLGRVCRVHKLASLVENPA